MKRQLLALPLALFLYSPASEGVQFEKLGSAIASVLGTTKASKKTVSVRGEKTDVYYSKKGAAPSAFAVVQTGLYPPDCTHTWVVGLDAKKRISKIRVVEMSCSHAHPTRENSFLNQFVGKGVADARVVRSVDYGNLHLQARRTVAWRSVLSPIFTIFTIDDQATSRANGFNPRGRLLGWRNSLNRPGSRIEVVAEFTCRTVDGPVSP